MRVWTTVMGQRLDGAENTRSMLLSAELIQRGHEVTMWTSAFDHIRKQWRTEWREARDGLHMRPDGLRVRFMKGCGYSRNVSVRRWLDHRLAAGAFLREASRESRPDVIVASLPDHLTAYAAMRFARKVGAKGVLDVRDKWPDVFIDRVGPRLAPIARMALVGDDRTAARAIRDSTAVVAMMDSMLQWALAKAERAPTWKERVFYLNTAPKNFEVEPPVITEGSAVNRILPYLHGKVVFGFVGTFNVTQHPSLILDAVELLLSSGRINPERTAFVIAGAGTDADIVERRCRELPNTHSVGWVNHEEMQALLRACHVGILAMTFPSPAFNNKAFSYLASGLPIINGATGDLADILEGEGAGINVTGGSVTELASAIEKLAKDEVSRLAMASATRRVFCDRFDRESNYRAYADHIETIAHAD